MTVSALIEWLLTQDQEATVEVLRGVRGMGWEGDSYRWDEFTIEDHTEYVDLRNNPFSSLPDRQSRTLKFGCAE